MPDKKHLRLGKYSIGLPGTKKSRTALGGVLILGGGLGFLPVLGFWMIPVGLAVLSIDYHSARRLRRRAEVWVARRHRKKQSKAQ
jgi:hypothetical protein